MSTVRDLITAALLDLGAIASGEAPTATEASDSLRRLNLLLETWRLERLMTWSIDTVTKVLTGASSYTIGPSGDINTTRPVALERASQRLAGTSPTLEYPLEPLTDEQFEGIALKGLPSTIARGIYMDRAFPLATISLWPVLPSGDTLVLYLLHPLTAFSSLDTTVALPPGYELAIQTSLSLELVSMFRDCTVTPALAAQAARSKALLKVLNSQARFLTLPSGLPTGQPGWATSRRGFLTGGNT
jgi:hypothetical protein